MKCWNLAFNTQCLKIIIVIVDSMQAYLLLWSCANQRFDVFNATQAKERIYCNRHIDQFFNLTILIFSCLHKHVDMFLYNCVNAIWSLKESEGFHLFRLIIFFCQNVWITLQRMQASFILSWVVVVCVTTFGL
jgi:hypothetical protein